MMELNKYLIIYKQKIDVLKLIKLLILLMIFVALGACSSLQNEVKEDIKPIIATYEIDENKLLNVSIKLFDTGILPEEKDKKRGLSKKIRNLEARYIPIHLKHTMQRTGYWANVRVIPNEIEGSEVIVSGKINNSDGENLELNIRVSDATNKIWFEKNYKETVTIEQNKNVEIKRVDRFQNIYNEISNDIIEYRKKMNSKEMTNIKNISEIKFANFMAPEIFSAYLGKEKEGISYLRRLPADKDSILIRVRAIKARDEMLIDTINNYYDMYYTDVWDSYNNWRKYRSEELENIREIERKSLTQKILGTAAIVGAIALGASSNRNVANRTGALRTVMIAGGGYAVYKGFQTSKESEINKKAIEELGVSFSNDVEPITVDVNGKTMTLTGNADQQYNKWRQLLKKIHIEETAF